jgi:hypothetical protein
MMPMGHCDIPSSPFLSVEAFMEHRSRRRRKAAFGLILCLSIVLCLSEASLPAHAGSIDHWSHSSQSKPSPALLYRSDFSKTGLAGWNTGGNPWKVSRGELTYDGVGSSSIIAPFVAKERDYAVIARIKAIAPRGRSRADRSFGVFVRKTRAAHSGVFGLSNFTPVPLYTGPVLAFGLDSVGGADIEPHAGYNGYRLDVHGTDYTLSINHKQAVHFVMPEYKDGTLVGIASTLYAISVKWFHVIRLPSRHPTDAPVPRVKRANINETDTAPLVQVYGHFFNNVETARLRKVPLQSVVDSGRTISYDAQFQPTGRTVPYGLKYIDCSITGFVSVAATRAGYTRELGLVRDVYGHFQSYKATKIGGLGDEATVARYGNRTRSRAGIVFRQGTYLVSMRFDFSGPIYQAGATHASQLATLVALRLKHG